MLPVIAFVVTDLLCKRKGWQTTSRLFREHERLAIGLLAWGIYHVFVEEYEYAD